MKHPIPVALSESDRASLQTFIHAGKANARTFTRARVLLKAAEGWTDQQICDAFDISRNTSIRVRQLYLQGGLEAVLHDKRQQRHRQALTGGQAAHLIAIACSPVPDGHDHWTLRLLAGKVVELGFVESISPETIRQLLKKNELKPWQHEHWCIPTVGAEFVAAMEDVLDLYEEDYDPRYPTVCFDEKLVAPEADVRPPLPMEPGHVERIDYEYERLGTANLFFFVEPLAGWRHVEMTQRRTKIDYAHCIRWLVDEVYPHAEYIRLVQDNLNTHTAAALYEAFEPAEARRILQRVEFHYTPKHGSWLNMAEIEIGIFARGCLSRRVRSLTELRQRIATLQAERNALRCTISWRFTCNDARDTLHDLYPAINNKLD
ncbi:IS630 family transposase [Ktedonobacter racemifer]|uniref:IS630 family transposase n=1 Tax=Ktedonobacter racemifer TaxID=363277 RepID=UPI003B75CA57